MVTTGSNSTHGLQVISDQAITWKGHISGHALTFPGSTGGPGSQEGPMRAPAARGTPQRMRLTQQHSPSTGGRADLVAGGTRNTVGHGRDTSLCWSLVPQGLNPEPGEHEDKPPLSHVGWHSPDLSISLRNHINHIKTSWECQIHSCLERPWGGASPRLCPVPSSWHGDSHGVTQWGTELQPWGPDLGCASLHVPPQTLCREQSLGPSSNQWETARWPQTCQGWLPLMGIREIGWVEWGWCMKMIFIAHLFMSLPAWGWSTTQLLSLL